MKRLSLLVAALAGIAGCGADYGNCRDVCNKRHDCVDSAVDVNKCSSSCSDKAASDANYARQVDVCQACLSGRACAEAFAPCLGDCAGVP
jgi:hypothetical protein